jgi:hypothetical protein
MTILMYLVVALHLGVVLGVGWYLFENHLLPMLKSKN